MSDPKKRRVMGFGYNPNESEHGFFVSIPSTEDGDVWISEHTKWKEEEMKDKIRAVQTTTDPRLRVILTRSKWNIIKEEVQVMFNERLREDKLPRGKWKSRGITPVSRLLGKELVLLAWGIEDAEDYAVENAILNWKGFDPSERWWLYNAVNAAHGQAKDGKSKGWRKALRYILPENNLPHTDPNTRRENYILSNEPFLIPKSSSENAVLLDYVSAN